MKYVASTGEGGEKTFSFCITALLKSSTRILASCTAFLVAAAYALHAAKISSGVQFLVCSILFFVNSCQKSRKMEVPPILFFVNSGQKRRKMEENKKKNSIYTGGT